MRSVRTTICASLLLLLLVSQAAGRSLTTHAAIQLQLSQIDSPWSRAVSPPFRSLLPRFADATVNRRHLVYDPASLTLSGTHETLFTNGTGHPLAALYMRTMAELWGPGKGAFSLTGLQVDGRPAAFTMGSTLITIPLAQPLAPGHSARITYATRATLPALDPSVSGRPLLSGNDGFYGAGPDITGLTAFPTILPNGDEGKEIEWPHLDALPADPVSLHEVWLTLPQDWTAIPLGTMLDEKPAGSGQKTVHAASVSPAIGLLISNTVARQTQKVGDVLVSTYVSPARAPFSDSLLQNAADALRVYQTVYGPMPLSKVDVVPMPLYDYTGAYWGGVMAVDPRNFDQPRKVRNVIFHEVAHAWWGELVAADPGWLPFVEPMANASTLYAFDQVDGPAAGDDQRTNFVTRYQKQRLLGMADAPLNWPVGKYKDADQRTVLTYCKGGLFYDQLRKLVGDEQFFAAMRSFLRQHAYEVVSWPGPAAELMSEPGAAALYRRWVEEAHGDEDLRVFPVEGPSIRQ